MARMDCLDCPAGFRFLALLVPLFVVKCVLSWKAAVLPFVEWRGLFSFVHRRLMK
jgi:hypothetical protein